MSVARSRFGNEVARPRANLLALATLDPVRSPGGNLRPIAPSSNPEAGIALFVVLVLLLIMLVLVGDLAITVHLCLRRARLEVAITQADEAARGAIERAKLVLMLDARTGGALDGLDDLWNQPAQCSYVLGEAQITVETVDENRKLNVYQLTGGTAQERGAALQRLVSVIQAARADTAHPTSSTLAQQTGESVRDYLRKRATRKGGNEHVPLPPIVKNHLVAPFELTLEAIPPDLYYDGTEGTEVLPGVERYLTSWGNAQVNLNTVDSKVLQAYFPGQESVGRRLLSARDRYRPVPLQDMAKSGSAQFRGFTSLEALKREGLLTGRLYETLNHFFTFASNYFSVTVTARVGSVSRTHRALVLRSSEGIRQLLYQVRESSEVVPSPPPGISWRGS